MSINWSFLAHWNLLKKWQEARDGSVAWKIRQRMKYDRNPLLVTIQDKYSVKAYAARRGVPSARCLYVTDQPETIPFDSLPENYFIKANHGCAWNIASIHGELYAFAHGEHFVGADGSPSDSSNYAQDRLSREQVIRTCQRWLNRRHRRKEWAYQQIEPRVFVEEALAQRHGGPFVDYRFYVMGGGVRMIMVSGPLFFKTGRARLLYDADWNPVDGPWRDASGLDKRIVDKPGNLGDMIQAAERLGHGIDFVRVDLYNTTQGVRVGEMTVYPDGGLPGKPSPSRALNKWLGEQWQMACRPDPAT